MALTNALRTMPLQQRQAGKLLAGFFALMLALTLVSRGLDSITVATVQTISPGYGSITRKITVNGTVQPLSERAVAAPDGYMVERVLVKEGARIEEGELIAILDISDIERKLSDAYRELQRAQINASLERVEPQLPESNPLAKAEQQLERAREDATTAADDAREAIARAQQDLARARRDRREAYQEGDYDDAMIEELNRAVTQNERLVEDAVRDAEKAEIDAERAIEDAERAVEEAQLESEISDAEDAASQEKKQLESRLRYLTLEECQVKVSELQALLASEGKVISPASGVITKLSIEAGGVTGSGGALVLGEGDVGSIFTGTVEESSGKYLAVGDSVRMTLPGVRDEVDAVITALTPPAEKGGEYTVKAELPGVDLEPGTAMTLTAEKTSGTPNTMLPLTALHSEGGSSRSGYVFVLREKNTTMGVQTVVEKIPVEIEEKNNESATVIAVFQPEDRVVSASSRSLSPGDRVRVESAT